MDRDRFEALVLELADEGTPLTVANVAAAARLSPRKAEEMMDAMRKQGHLDMDVDEDEGVVIYRVKGLTRRVTVKRSSLVGSVLDEAKGTARRAARSAVVDDLRQGVRERARDALTQRPGEKNVLVGGALGLFLGPLGLAYSAPWSTVVITLLAYMGAATIPLIRTIFGFFALFIHVGFAIAGALYAHRYNQKGERAPILPAEEPKKRLPR